MNNYHLYEEIGHGKFSTVYKGRKRYTIRYVAVKSIEKGRRDKVMTEVRVLSQLEHPNVVGFVNWYETRNHLWIIFEYCAGGELLRLVKQDGRLPENQVRLFCRDIFSGLLHVHTHSIIYTDLKTNNILFNESGVLKLCDFGHAQHLDDVQRMLEEKAPFPRRGTPHYMAPELFQEGGMHSFASDVWACGCVTYELAAGRPPFHTTSFQQIRQLALREPMPLVPGISANLQSLLASLLRKSPLDRISWPDIRAHAFWQSELPGIAQDVESLPAQPHEEDLHRLWQRVCGATEQAAFGSPNSGNRDELMDMQSPMPSEPSSSPAKLRTHGQPEMLGCGSDPSTTADLRSRRPSEVSTAVGISPARVLDFGTNPLQQATPEIDAEPDVFGKLGNEQLVPTSIVQQGGGVAASETQNAHAQGLAATGTVLNSGLKARVGTVAFNRVRELFAPVDTAVKPISRNPDIEEPEHLEVSPDLPFAPLFLDDASAHPHADLESFLAKVYRCLAQSPSDQKVSALLYLESLCGQQIRVPRSCQIQVADLMVNSSIMRLVVRLLQVRRQCGQVSTSAANPLLKERLLALIGQLLRHATYVEVAISDLGLFDALLENLAEQDVRLRRRASAALGELLFYIATQITSADQSNGETGSASQCLPSAWQVPDRVLSAVVDNAFNHDGDEVAQHYAVKTIENIATQCPVIAHRWFFHTRTLQGLAVQIRRSTWDSFRASCLAAIAHLVSGRAEIADRSIGPVIFPDPDVLTMGFTELAPRGIPQALTLLSAILLQLPEGSLVTSVVSHGIIGNLVAVMSQPRFNACLRARAMVLLVALFTWDNFRDPLYFKTAIDMTFAPLIDKLAREKDSFVVACIGVATTITELIVSSVMQGLVDTFRQLAGVQGAEAATLAEIVVQVLLAFPHLVSSAVLGASVLNNRTLPLLGAICELAARLTPQAGGSTHQVQAVVLTFVEALSAQQAVVLEHAPLIVRCILVPLTPFLPNSRGDIRLLALKSLAGICVTLLNDYHVFDPMSENPSETTLLLETILCGRVLPAFPALLGDESPTPSYAFRLLASLLSRGSQAAAAAVRDLGLASHLLAALGDEQALTLHSALLAHCLLHGREVRVRDLGSSGLLRAAHATLADAAEGAAGQTAQLDFAMIDATLGVLEEALFQQVETAAGNGASTCHALLGELGELAHSLPLLATLCPSLAKAMHAPLLDRVVFCNQQLTSLASRASPNVIAGLSGQHVAGLIEALATVAQWQSRGGTIAVAPAIPRGLQRRLLAVLNWAVASETGTEVRAVVAAGVEQLLRDNAFGDDRSAFDDARRLVSVAVPMVGGHG